MLYTILLTNSTPPLSQIATNLGFLLLSRPYVTISTYKLAIAKYKLNFKLICNHLFIPLNLGIFYNYCNSEFLFESMHNILNYSHGRKLIEDRH